MCVCVWGVSVIQKTLNPLESRRKVPSVKVLFITTPGEENEIYLSIGKRAWIGRVNPPLFWEIDKQC